MARKKRLLWQIFFFYLLVILITVFGAMWYGSRTLRSFFLKEKTANLETTARLFQRQILPYINPLNQKAIDELCNRMGRSVPSRFTVIHTSGRVLGDSEEDPSRMDNHKNRPEVKGALGGALSTSIRFSKTLLKPFLYVALPLKRDGRIIGVVRTSLPVDDIEKTLNAIQQEILAGGLIIAAFAAGLSVLISYRLRRPIQEIRKGAERFARGEFAYRVLASDVEELGALSEAMNQMAAELRERINTISEQRNELQAVLSSMAEGVLAVDEEQRIIGMNQAASQFFGCDPHYAEGRSIQEVIRHPDLHRLVRDTLSNEASMEGDIMLYGDEERVLNGRGTSLLNAGGERVGGLVVLNDVTRLRRLENIRRDFVANVSHEIKTPITTIKGFVETLRDGRAKDPRDAKRFLETMGRHVDRLQAIVEDLLTLARVEQGVEKEEVKLHVGPIREVLLTAVETCQDKAEAKRIPIKLFCDQGLEARINAPLFEQAVVNLLDNAVKYSEAENPVTVQAVSEDNEVVIKVIDHGCGIEKRHLSRLFERFYRVDKARSRGLGGTGLGLAIVKHIMNAHNGYVSVKSEPGKGSVFALHLPKP